MSSRYRYSQITVPPRQCIQWIWPSGGSIRLTVHSQPLITQSSLSAPIQGHLPQRTVYKHCMAPVLRRHSHNSHHHITRNSAAKWGTDIRAQSQKPWEVLTPTGLLAFSVLAHLTNSSSHSVYAHNRSWSGNRWRERYRERERKRERGRCVGVREESENNIIPHCLQRIGTSLARYFGLVFFVVVGWGRLVAQAPLEDWRGTAKARSLPSRSSLALITPSTTLMSSCQALHACYKSQFRGLCLSDWMGWSSAISPPQIQLAPLLFSVCQQV